MKKVFILMAEGFEIVEALAPVDACGRSNVQVKMVSIENTTTVHSSHGVEVTVDQKWDDTDFNEGNAIVLPGGYPGYMNIAKSKKVGALLHEYFNKDKIVAAICGSPYALVVNGLAKDRYMTCHHSVIDKMEGYLLDRKKVVVDGNLITGRGAGCSFDFSIALITALTDKDTVLHLRRGLELLK